MTDASMLFLAGAGAGLLAGGTSCAAVQLGLLTGAVRGATHPAARVGVFLAAKLTTHAALGAALGLAGSVVQPGPRVRAALLACAAVLLAFFAFDLLGFRPARRLLRRRSGHCHDHYPDQCHDHCRDHWHDHCRDSGGDHCGDQCRGSGDDSPGDCCGCPDNSDVGEKGDSSDSSGCGGCGGEMHDDGVIGIHREPSAEQHGETRGGSGGRGGEGGRGGGGGGHRTPLLLGAATVLVPCGLTLSAELMAVTSRSAPAGAAVMTGFVLGTVPLFGLIGVTVGRGLALLRGRLTALVGVGLLLLAGWTLLSGLRLGGWLPGPATTAATDARFVRTDSAGTQTITIWALDRGYRPAQLSARAGVRSVLVVRTLRTSGCTRVFEIPARGVERVLPVNGSATIDLGTPRPGRVRFTCAVGHYPGAITFR